MMLRLLAAVRAWLAAGYRLVARNNRGTPAQIAWQRSGVQLAPPAPPAPVSRRRA